MSSATRITLNVHQQGDAYHMRKGEGRPDDPNDRPQLL